MKSWRVWATNLALFLAWVFQLPLVGFTSDIRPIVQLLVIVLLSSIVSLALLKSYILDYNGLRKKVVVKQLPFFFTASIVVCVVLVYGLSDRAYTVIFLPMLEEWFFRGLLLPSLALLNVKVAIVASSLLFSLCHYFHFKLEALVGSFVFGVLLSLIHI